MAFPTSGVIAYWKLDESSGNAADSSGSGNTLVNQGGVTYTAGKINNGSVHSATSNAYFKTTSQINSSTLTVSMWVYMTTIDANYNGFIGFLSNGALNNHTSGGGFRYESSGGNITSGTTLVINTWYHIVLTMNGTSGELFLNGSSVGTGTASSMAVNQNYVVGSYGDSASNHMRGTIDEVGIWNRVLSGSEITDLYNGGAGISYSTGTNYPITAAQGSYTLTGQVTGLLQALRMLGAYATYTYTGFDTIFKLGKGFSADFGSYVVTGNDTMFSKVISLVADYGSYALTGVSVTIQKGISIAITTGSYVLTGFSARLPRYWTNIAKSVTNWINNTKNGATWNNQDKSDI